MKKSLIYPGNSVFYFTGDKVSEVDVYDIHGCKIIHQFQGHPVTQTDLSGMSAGVYYFYMKSDRGNVIRKVQKK